MTGTQQGRRFGGVGQFVVLEGLAVADCVSRPLASMFLHEREQQPGIEPPAEKDAHRNVAQQMPLDRTFVKVQQLVRRFFLAPCLGALSVFDDQHRSRSKLSNAPENREGRRCVAKFQEQVQSRRIDVGQSGLGGQQRTDF